MGNPKYVRQIAPFAMGFIFVIACALALWVGLERPRAPRMSITFLGYTNDFNGSRLAAFTIINKESSAIQWYAPRVLIRGRNDGIQFRLGGAVVGSGASMNLTVPAPMEKADWRLQVYVYKDIGVTRFVKTCVTIALLRIGFKPRYQGMPYFMYSDWIQGQDDGLGLQREL